MFEKTIVALSLTSIFDVKFTAYPVANLIVKRTITPKTCNSKGQN
ncbi:hypothetical protein [Providencia sp. Me31A]